MSIGRERRRNVDDAIFCDEIGIEYGIHGEYRLWSAYQPIFAPCDGQLAAVAVEGLVEARHVGAPIASAAFFDDVRVADRLFVETMCRSLHLRNFRNVGVDRLELFFNYNPLINDHPGRALAEIRLMACRLHDVGIRADRLVCEITEQAAPDDKVLVKLVREMRRNGIRIAIDDFGADHSTEERVQLIKPDFVKIDGAWFAEICRHAATGRFFRLLVSALHDQGAKVLVEGIERPAQLRVALESGVDLLQGFLLARPALAGSIFNEAPLEIESLLQSEGKIVPFPTLHQRR